MEAAISALPSECQTHSLRYSSPETLLVARQVNRLWLILASDRTLWTAHYEREFPYAFTPAHQHDNLVVGYWSEHRTQRALQGRGPRRVVTLEKVGPYQPIDQGQFSPDGRYFAANSKVQFGAPFLGIWEVGSGKNVAHLSGWPPEELAERRICEFAGAPLTRRVGCVFSADSKKVVLVCSIGESWEMRCGWRIWNSETHSLTSSQFPMQEIDEAAFTFDGSELITSKGALYWNTLTGRFFLPDSSRRFDYSNPGVPDSNDFTDWTDAYDVSPDGDVFAQLTDSDVKIYSISKRQLLQTLPGYLSSRFTGRVFSPDSRKIVLCTDEGVGTAVVWDIATKTALGRFSGGCGFILQSAEFSPDGTMILTYESKNAEDRVVRARLYSLEAKELLQEFVDHGTTEPEGINLITFVGFSPRGDAIAVRDRIYHYRPEPPDQLSPADLTTPAENAPVLPQPVPPGLQL